MTPSRYRLASEDDSPYIRDIRRAERLSNSEGKPLIRYGKDEYRATLGIDDEAHGHIDTPEASVRGMRSTNCRDFTSLAFGVLLDMQKGSSLKTKLLFLGPGSGVECAQARKHLPDAYIETRSLLPINPFRVPLVPAGNMHRFAWKLAKDPSWQKTTVAQSLARHVLACTEALPPSLLMKIDAQLPSPVFFGQLPDGKVLIDEQSIGYFPDELPIEGIHDFICDHCGPMQKIDAANFFDALIHVQEHLADAGALVVEAYPNAVTAMSASGLDAIRDSLTAKNSALVNPLPHIQSLVVGSHERIHSLMVRQPEMGTVPWRLLSTVKPN